MFREASLLPRFVELLNSLPVHLRVQKAPLLTCGNFLTVFFAVPFPSFCSRSFRNHFWGMKMIVVMEMIGTIVGYT
ncbi:hypothetical protein LCGC14_2359690 [marine sediment metagenome]|uniref:Uncharacterized protein n=1 Tax=marine sediment metagenome TaxID=412755 RepID=A0A0F9CU80_9ZZZZ